MKLTPEEFERVVAAYQGGTLREGVVPIGAELVPDGFGVDGFTVTVAPHPTEAALAIVTLERLPSGIVPAALTTSPPDVVVAIPKEG